MPDSLTSIRPGPLAFSSLAEIYSAYERLFLQGHEYMCDLRSECGLDIRVFDRCFLHLVQLKREDGGATLTDWFNIQDERPRLRAQVEGLGPYRLDEYRARHLPSGLDTMLRPHLVFELKQPKTAYLAFLKHYGDKPYPVMFTLVGRSASDGCLIPVTCFPSRLNQARNRFKKLRRQDGVVWRRGDAPLRVE